MPEQNHQALLLLEQLQSARSLDEALKLYQQQILTLGYEGVLYGIAPKLFATDALFNQPVYKACGLFSDEFLKYYFEHNLQKHDFTVKSIISGCMDELDWGSEAERSRRTIQEKNVLDIAARYGLKNGLTIPLMNNCNGFSAISVSSSKNYTEFNQLNRQKLDLLRQCSRIFNSHVWAIYRNQLGRLSAAVVLDKLTPTELELLRELTTGDMLKVIYQRMNKTTSYGDNILGRLRKKMGDITTNRLIYYGSLLVGNDYI